jgi:pyrimidine-nucleoside phosphorylase
LFPKAKFEAKVKANKSGYIKSMNTENIGKISGYLGAGRETKDEKIDYSAGIKVFKKTSEYVNEGEEIACLYTNKEEKIEEAVLDYLNSLEIVNEPQEEPTLIYEVIE